MIQDLQWASANEQKSARSTICQWHSRCIKIVLCEKRHRALHVLEPGSKVFHAEEVCSCIRRAKLGKTTHHYWIPLMFSLSEEHNNGKVQSHAQFRSLTESVSLSLDVLHRHLTLKSSSGNFLATSRYATPKEMCRSLSDSLRFSQLWGQGHHLVGVKVSGPGKLLVTVVRKQRKNKKMKAYESEQRLHLTLPGYCFASFLAEDARQRRRWRDENLYLNGMATWQWDCFVVWRPASVDATSLILTKPLHRGFNHSACVRGPPIAYQERFIEDVAIRIPTCSDTTPVQSLCTSSQQAAGNSRYCLQNHQRRSECVNEISLVSLVAWKSCLWWSVIRSSVIRSI